MDNIQDFLNTAHISITTCTLKVAVDDLNKYEALFNPRCKQIDDDILEEGPEWKIEMEFPGFVLSVSPWLEDKTLSIWCEWPVDLNELNNWLKTFK